jgi:hypothetical protein
LEGAVLDFCFTVYQNNFTLECMKDLITNYSQHLSVSSAHFDLEGDPWHGPDKYSSSRLAPLGHLTPAAEPTPPPVSRWWILLPPPLMSPALAGPHTSNDSQHCSNQRQRAVHPIHLDHKAMMSSHGVKPWCQAMMSSHDVKP